MQGMISSIWRDIRSPAGMETLRFAIRLFMVLMAYYLMKPIREALILNDNSAELRSYALAAQAGLLLIIVPFYSHLIKRFMCEHLFRVITLFMASNILVFYVLGLSNIKIGIPFFIWLGIFSVVEIAQFWAMVGDFHCVESAKRLMAYIAVGGSFGALIGSIVARLLFPLLGAYHLMLLSMILLVLTLLPFLKHSPVKKDKQDELVEKNTEADDRWQHMFGGFRHIVSMPYLRWITLFIILLNLVNSTGEYILAHFVVEMFANSADKSLEIGEFYSLFYIYVNALTLFLQFFMARPMFRLMGVGGALKVLTVINVSMYISAFFVPVLAWFTVVKVVENGIDYSLINTTKQILFLPLERRTRYESLTTITTFFKRFGDILQGGVIFVCVPLLGLSLPSLLLVNTLFCFIWVFSALQIGHHFKTMTLISENTSNDSG